MGAFTEEQKSTALSLHTDMGHAGIDFEAIEYVPARDVTYAVFAAIWSQLDRWRVPR